MQRLLEGSVRSSEDDSRVLFGPWGRTDCFTWLLFGAALLGSAVLHAYLALGLEAVNGRRAVGLFLVVLTALFTLYGLAAWAAGRGSRANTRHTVGLIFVGAVLFRLLLLPAGLPLSGTWEAAKDDLQGRRVGFERFLLYDHDVWRYLWDGHLLANGVSPYASTPAEIEARAEAGQVEAESLLVEPVWQDVHELMPFREYRTVYPPFAQAAFALSSALAPGSVLLWKLLVVLADLATCLLLLRLLEAAGRPSWWLLLYAWNPLVIKEIAGSGHVEALVMLGLVAAATAWARGRPSTALAALGLGILAKITPLAVVPAVVSRLEPRRWWVLGGVVALGLLPFAGSLPGLVAGLATMGRQWQFNAGVWDLLRVLGDGLAEGWGKPLANTTAALVWAGVAWVVAGRAWRRGWQETSPTAVSELARDLYLLTMVALLFSPTVMPWYCLWVLPFAILARRPAGLAWSALACLSYLVYIDGTEPVWARVVEHGVVWVLLVWEGRKK